MYQKGGIARITSTEHVTVLKTWMKILETNGETGILQAFNMEQFFDEEVPIDTAHYTQCKKGGTFMASTINIGWVVFDKT